MNFNVEDYIGEIITMAWNLGYDVTIDDNNDIVMEHQTDTMYAAVIKAKFMHSGNKLESGDEFWYNAEMIFPKNKITFDEGTSVGFEWITRQWHKAASIAERLNEISWFVEE